MKAKYMQGSFTDECVLDPVTYANGDIPYTDFYSGLMKGINDSTEGIPNSVSINTDGIGFLVIRMKGANLAYNAVYLIQASLNQGSNTWVETQIGTDINFYGLRDSVTRTHDGNRQSIITITGDLGGRHLDTFIAFYRLSS